MEKVGTAHIETQDPAKPYHHGRLRESLVEAAVRALENHPPESISLRELARVLGVSPNAPYRHFEDKEALLNAAVKAGFEDMANRFADAMQAAPEAALDRFGDIYVQFAVERPHLFRLMFSGRNPEETMEDPGPTFSFVLQAVANRIGAEIDSLETRTAALGAWCLVHGVAMLTIDGELNRAGCPSIPLQSLMQGMQRLSIASQPNCGATG